MTEPTETGFREVKPRKQKDTPSKRRRKLLRAIRRALEAREGIDAAARARQREREAGGGVASRTMELEGLYHDLCQGKRDIYATGIPEGTPYRGRLSPGYVQKRQVRVTRPTLPGDSE